MKKLLSICILITLLAGAAFTQEDDIQVKLANGMVGACQNGNLNLIKTILALGGNVNAKVRGGYCGIMTASLMGHIEVVKFLVSKGANVNAKSDDGRTALMFASIKGQIQIVKLLINKGADVNAKTANTATALNFAIGSESPNRDRVIRLLKAAGARKSNLNFSRHR
jgi:ankyrin repeat protein